MSVLSNSSTCLKTGCTVFNTTYSTQHRADLYGVPHTAHGKLFFTYVFVVNPSSCTYGTRPQHSDFVVDRCAQFGSSKEVFITNDMLYCLNQEVWDMVLKYTPDFLEGNISMVTPEMAETIWPSEDGASSC